MYLMLCVRPDICYAVGHMVRFQQHPCDTHWQSLKKTVRYLRLRTIPPIKVYGNTVSWASRKQQTVAMSSCEAEYVALSAAASEGIWLKALLDDLGEMQANEPFQIYEDNHDCIAMAKKHRVQTCKTY